MDFTVTGTAGDARTGHLTVNDKELSTPHLFPVVNFYCGGISSSLYGGGIFRTIKEFLINHPRVAYGNDFSEYFQGIMTSIASLTDFNISEDRFYDYLSTPIPTRSEFETFDGVLFVDSGGYKILQKGGLHGSNFSLKVEQETAYSLQRAFGGDIVVNLDHPISPDDEFHERCQKAGRTAAYITEFTALSDASTEARYLTIHGYNKSMIERFFTTVEQSLEVDLARAFDGIALGSLVPKKDDTNALIEAVTAVRDVLTERNLDHLPLHVLGISGRAIPLLVALGVDSFDSSSYLHAAINGQYKTSFFDSVHIDDATFTDCGCPVCQTADLRDAMNGNETYQKDILGPVAVHNLIVQQNELAEMRRQITKHGKDAFVDYLEAAYRDQPDRRKYAYRVIDNRFKSYF